MRETIQFIHCVRQTGSYLQELLRLGREAVCQGLVVEVEHREAPLQLRVRREELLVREGVRPGGLALKKKIVIAEEVLPGGDLEGARGRSRALGPRVDWRDGVLLWFRVWGSGCRVWGLGFRLWVVGLRVEG